MPALCNGKGGGGRQESVEREVATFRMIVQHFRNDLNGNDGRTTKQQQREQLPCQWQLQLAMLQLQLQLPMFIFILCFILAFTSRCALTRSSLVPLSLLSQFSLLGSRTENPFGNYVAFEWQRQISITCVPELKPYAAQTTQHPAAIPTGRER